MAWAERPGFCIERRFEKWIEPEGDRLSIDDPDRGRENTGSTEVIHFWEQW